MTSNARWKCLAGACALALAVCAPAARAMDNPVARGTLALGASAPIDGVWNGTDLERRSNCTSADNDGSRGTYAEFDPLMNGVDHTLAMDQKGITGLNCSYDGPYTGSGATLSWSGHYSCTDGKRGTFTSRSVLVTQNALSIHLDVQLDTTETCKIEKVIGAGRLYP